MYTEFYIRITVAALLGGVIGLEREIRQKEAGFRTHFLVAAGSALIMIVSKYGFSDILGTSGISLDPSRIAAQVVSGVGFLGAGTIILRKDAIKGLTTAAGIWITAGIGMAIGAGMYHIGVFSTIVVLIGLEIFQAVFKSILTKSVRVFVKMDSDKANEIFEIINKKNSDMSSYQSKYEDIDNKRIYIMDFKVRVKQNKKLCELVREIEKIDGVISTEVEIA